MMDRQQKKKGITTSFKSGSTDNNNTDGQIHIFNHHVYDECLLVTIWFKIMLSNTTLLVSYYMI